MNKIEIQHIIDLIKQNDEHPERGEIKYISEGSDHYFYRNSKEGYHEEWYNNGQLYKRCNYKNGKLDGLYEEWYDNGEKCRTIMYENGMKNGCSIIFIKDDLYIVKEFYKNNSPIGLSISWKKKKRGRKDSISVCFFEISFLAKNSIDQIKKFKDSLFQ